ILQKNIKKNKLPRVKIFNFALSNKVGETSLHVSFEENNPWTWGDTIIYNMWGDEDNDKKVTVKTVLLSNYITKPVDLLKMDIEGSEQMVLEEIEHKLSFIREIVMEYHGTRTSINVNNFLVIRSVLERNGFIVKSYTKDLKFAFPNFVANLRKTSSVFTIKALRS
ncbi:FkbM family methyltransferase, partial [Candidatus Gottesmanbacteria bacterium]|nr:FkbM family methyltransferase [Candidatus Gottesmanbacteria bacterium]